MSSCARVANYVANPRSLRRLAIGAQATSLPYTLSHEWDDPKSARALQEPGVQPTPHLISPRPGREGH